MSCFAAVDVGSNSVKLLVAEKSSDGSWTPLSQRTEVTRLGRGVDETGALSPEGVAATLEAVTSLVKEARALGVGRSLRWERAPLGMRGTGRSFSLH